MVKLSNINKIFYKGTVNEKRALTDINLVLDDGDFVTVIGEANRAKYIGRVFQDPMLGTASNMWIEENLTLACRRGERRGLNWMVNSDKRKMFRERLEVLNLGLEDRMTTKVGLLSGGQRQAITLLMATI
ncbi:MAG: ABC transporter ATP-binding protein, partial [Lachnospiraceae bacterium]|nr:ABC transporter ATP-binding protein [Lachnospiraceae bacterium]